MGELDGKDVLLYRGDGSRSETPLSQWIPSRGERYSYCNAT